MQKILRYFVFCTWCSCLALSFLSTEAQAGGIRVPTLKEIGQAAGKAANDVLGGGAKVITEVLDPPAKETTKVLNKTVKPAADAVVGEPLKVTGDAAVGTATAVGKVAEGVGNAAGDVLEGTAGVVTDVLDKPTRELSNGMTDVVKYIEENPIEAAMIVVAATGVGVLAYSIAIEGAVINVAIAEGVFTVGVYEGLKDDSPSESSREIEKDSGGDSEPPAAPSSDDSQSAETTTDVPVEVQESTETPTDAPVVEQKPDYQLSNIPQRPAGKMYDMPKVRYAEDVVRFIKENPIDMYQENGLPEETTVQEEKMIDALVLLKTIPKSYGDKLVEQRDEAGGPASVGRSFAEGLPGGPQKAGKDAANEAMQQALVPSVVSDATPLNQRNLKRLGGSIEAELNEYIKMRVPTLPAPPTFPSNEDIEEAFEDKLKPDLP